jgi:hypothetical protein
MAFQALKSKATGHSQGLAYLTDITQSIAGVAKINTLEGDVDIAPANDGTHSPTIAIGVVGQVIKIQTTILCQHGQTTFDLAGGTANIAIALPEPYGDTNFSFLATLADTQEDAVSWVFIVSKTANSVNVKVKSADVADRTISMDWGTIGANPVVL